MPVNKTVYLEIKKVLEAYNASLVAVSKTKSVEEIQELYNMGQRDFGENYVQELLVKQTELPKDIRWHFIGHLQKNKVKYIAPFIYCIQSVDSLTLLKEIQKEAQKSQREELKCLLQVHIAKEETKFGLSSHELEAFMNGLYTLNIAPVKIAGLMGMASLTNDKEQVKQEFHYLKSLYDLYKNKTSASVCFEILSMGMSSDYEIALQEGSNMVRIGSLLFGKRN